MTPCSSSRDRGRRHSASCCASPRCRRTGGERARTLRARLQRRPGHVGGDPWLQEELGYDVITLTADLGESKDVDAVATRALRTGALSAHVADARRVFVDAFCFPTLAAGARVRGCLPARHRAGAARSSPSCSSTSPARREPARWRTAAPARATTRCASTSPSARSPPSCGWSRRCATGTMGRPQELEYAAAHGIEVPVTRASPYSVDANLWGRSIEAGVLEDPWIEPPDDVYAWTAHDQRAETWSSRSVSSAECRCRSTDARLEGDRLVSELNALAGARGVGRIDHVENRLVGIKSREVYEAPAAVTLHAAHHALESLTITRDVARFQRIVADEWARLVYDGLWFSALRTALDAFVQETQVHVTGAVRMRLAGRSRPGRRQARGAIAVQQRPRDLRPGRATPSTMPRREASSSCSGSRCAPRPACRERSRTRRRSTSSGAPSGVATPDRRARGGARATKVWAGRLSAPTSDRVEAYTSSLAVDRRLGADDVAGLARSRAHAAQHRRAHRRAASRHRQRDCAPSPPSCRAMPSQCRRATRTSTRRSSAGSSSWPVRWRACCTPGAAATTRWPPTCACGLGAPARTCCVAVAGLQEALRRARRRAPHSTDARVHPPAARPGRVARAPPAGLRRDVRSRCAAARAPRVPACDELPLGSGALAGSTLPLDRDRVAHELGFGRIAANSMDAVADRDFAVEITAACALTMVHCSRLGEELVLWSSAEFGFVEPARQPRHRLVADAAEEERGRRRACPGQERTGHRRPGRAAHGAQGPAAHLQPRPAGGQGAALRRRRHHRGHAAACSPR